MHSTVRRIPHPSRPGRRSRFERDEKLAAPRHAVRPSRVGAPRLPVPSFRAFAGPPPRRFDAEPTEHDERPSAASCRSTVWLGTWHSSREKGSISVRVGQRAGAGFVLHLVVRIGRGDLHRLLFVSDDVEVNAVIHDINTGLVANLQLPPLAWNGSDASAA